MEQTKKNKKWKEGYESCKKEIKEIVGNLEDWDGFIDRDELETKLRI